ncbi:Fe-S-containing protein [Bifidobacterium apri]|uniref:Fe-S-containing protein n=1 Tax=Bifidobacterium apri TaxID=1769423 RepID=UPI00399242F0
MLKQFVTVMPGTLPVALLVMSLGVMLDVGEGRDRPVSATWRRWGLSIGMVAAVIFGALRATSVINQRSAVNFPVLVVAIIMDIAAIVAVTNARRLTANWQRHPALLNVANAVAALCIALSVFYAVPDVILQLTVFVEPGESPFTSEMLLRALGFLLGVGMSIIVAAICRTMRTTAFRSAFTIAATAVVVLVTVQHLTAILQIAQGGMIMLHGVAFRILVWLINHASWIVQAQAWVFAVPAFASIIAGVHMPLQGADAAESRKHRAFRRKAISAAAWSLIAMIGVSLTLTVGVNATTQTVTLSPPESYSLKHGVATITFAQVSDGHLHRFQYKAKDGTVMRFIIIKKNGGAYGIGLDACDNCGDAGYYEKDGKIICKKCDVAINLATIGFKGGCNPVPLPYKAGNGKITIQTADLDALSAHFQ